MTLQADFLDEIEERTRCVTRKDTASARREDIVARLYAALDEKMREIENRIAIVARTGEGVSPAESERDARTLTALARLYEKLSEIEGAKKGSGDTLDADLASKEYDAQHIRGEIAGRLERMLEAGED